MNYLKGCLSYNMCEESLSNLFKSTPRPFKDEKNISTQLPGNIVAIRIVATAAFTALIAIGLGSTLFCWFAVAIGVASIGWTIYSHLCVGDPLTKTFHKICGGKKNFEKLPLTELQYNSQKKLSHAIQQLKWSELPRISRAKTLDNRMVIIVKAEEARMLPQIEKNGEKGNLKADDSSDISSAASRLKQRIFVYVPKLTLFDLSHLSRPSVASFAHGVFSMGEGNTFKADFEGKDVLYTVTSSLPGKMANEFYAEMQNLIPSYTERD